MRFDYLGQAQKACKTINDAFAKRGHTQPIFRVQAWAYGFEVVEIKVELPK